MSVLSFSNLSYSYDKKKNVLNSISAELELGKIYAVLGTSGCGKTTLLSLLGGLDIPARGKSRAPRSSGARGVSAILLPPDAGGPVPRASAPGR